MGTCLRHLSKTWWLVHVSIQSVVCVMHSGGGLSINVMSTLVSWQPIAKRKTACSCNTFPGTFAVKTLWAISMIRSPHCSWLTSSPFGFGVELNLRRSLNCFNFLLSLVSSRKAIWRKLNSLPATRGYRSTCSWLLASSLKHLKQIHSHHHSTYIPGERFKISIKQTPL